jgi:hypothetical protein
MILHWSIFGKAGSPTALLLVENENCLAEMTLVKWSWTGGYLGSIIPAWHLRWETTCFNTSLQQVHSPSKTFRWNHRYTCCHCDYRVGVTDDGIYPKPQLIVGVYAWRSSRSNKSSAAKEEKPVENWRHLVFDAQSVVQFKCKFIIIKWNAELSSLIIERSMRVLYSFSQPY